MEIMHLTCRNCSGMGHTIDYAVVDRDEDTTTIKPVETVCGCCKGRGYTEYAMFDMDEAKAILKHCLLSTES